MSAITGQISFDTSNDNDKGTSEDIAKQSNLLRRECYRIFEKIARESYPEEPLEKLE